jgi:electron transfer flavoprotein alpha subunit
MSTILVLAEHDGTRVRKATLTTLDFARKLAADIDGEIHFAVLGHNVSAIAEQLTGYGATAIHLADHVELAHALAPTWGKVLADIALANECDVVCGSGSTLGKDVLPRTAMRLEAGMASDVVGIVDVDDEVGFRRPMWAGALLADVVIDTENWVMTARSSAFDAAPETGGATAITAFAAEPGLADSRTRFISFDGTETDRPGLDEADIVVSGGRGLKSAEGFAQVMEPLADSLGAAIGASRAAVDDGYAPNDYQVGQTGKVVAPQLYFAVAISGAIQHLAGMKNSKVIVAINTRDDEPIHKIADYSVQGDAFTLVPELIEKINALKG